MAKTKDKVSDAAGNVKPYVDRALHDEELRDNLRSAYASARSIYDELIGKRGVSGVATRVATDKDIQDELRSTIDELRKAADRVQGNEPQKGRNGGLLLLGIVLGILFNPLTGPSTRKWLSNRVFGGGDDFTYQGGSGRQRQQLAARPTTGFEAGCCACGSSSPPSPSCAVGAIARCSDCGSSPVALEMSELCRQDRARLRRGGARSRATSPQPSSKRTSCRCFHASRYFVGSTAPS